MHAFKTTDDEQILTTKNEQRSKNIAKLNKTFKIQKIEKKKRYLPILQYLLRFKNFSLFLLGRHLLHALIHLHNSWKH